MRVTNVFVLLFIFPAFAAQAQSFAGLGYGTFNVPGASPKFRGLTPTLKYEFVGARQRTSTYLDVSYFTRTPGKSTVTVRDSLGNPLGSATVQEKNVYLYMQTGFKKFFGGDADEKKLLPYLGAGVAVAFAKTTTSYQSSVSHINSDVTNRTLFGFHFNAGVQYNIKPVILELRGNFDIVLQPIDPDSDVSNILTNLRLSALIPFTK